MLPQIKLFMKKVSIQKRVRNDIILTASVLTVAVLAFLIISLIGQKGGYAEVKKDGKIIGKYPLSRDIEVEIENGVGYNLLVIKDGKAYITEADCPDKLCVRQGSAEKNGETIVCLPNKTVVTIRSGEPSDTDF